MNQEIFLEFFNKSEKKRKRIKSLVFFVALAFSVLGIALMLLGFFKTDVNLTSALMWLVPIGVAYFAVGASFFLTWVNFDMTEDSDLVTTHVILMTFEENQKKIDENNKLVQELLNKLQMEGK